MKKITLEKLAKDYTNSYRMLHNLFQIVDITEKNNDRSLLIREHQLLVDSLEDFKSHHEDYYEALKNHYQAVSHLYTAEYIDERLKEAADRADFTIFVGERRVNELAEKIKQLEDEQN